MFLFEGIYSLVSKECKKTTEIKPSGQVNGIAESAVLDGNIYRQINSIIIITLCIDEGVILCKNS